MRSDLPIVFDPDKVDELPIKLSGPRRRKYNEAAKEAAVFARYGSTVLRLKAQTLAALGKAAEQAGIKQIGHGRVMVASENAEQAIATLGAFVQELVKAKPCPDHTVILDIMRLVREFNHQLIVTAQMHISADKQTLMEPTARTNSLPPPGATVMIAIGKENGGKPS